MPRGSRIPTRQLLWLQSITAADCVDCGAPLRIVRLPDGTTSPDAAFNYPRRRLYCATGPCAEARAQRAASYRRGGRPSSVRGTPVLSSTVVVILTCTKERVPEDAVTFENIEEDMTGRDVLTFRCPRCGESHRSLRLG